MPTQVLSLSPKGSHDAARKLRGCPKPHSYLSQYTRTQVWSCRSNAEKTVLSRIQESELCCCPFLEVLACYSQLIKLCKFKNPSEGRNPEGPGKLWSQLWPWRQGPWASIFKSTRGIEGPGPAQEEGSSRGPQPIKLASQRTTPLHNSEFEIKCSTSNPTKGVKEKLPVLNLSMNRGGEIFTPDCNKSVNFIKFCSINNTGQKI